MGWRFEPGEKLDGAFRRVAIEEIGKMRAGLLGRPAGQARAVHEARQGFKRLRAMARLARRSLGKDFDTENARWRDLGKLLSGLRDRHVLLESFETAVEGCGAALPADGVEYLRTRLQAATVPLDADASAREADALLRLEAAERDIAGRAWPKSQTALLAGLRESQKRLRRGWKRARRTSDAEAFHAWRKRVKDQAAQLRLFRGVETVALRKRRADAKQTAECLGEEHDLWILAETLRAETCPAGIVATREALLDAIEKRRAELREQAFQFGATLSSEHAKAFAEAVLSAWKKGVTRPKKKPPRKSTAKKKPAKKKTVRKSASSKRAARRPARGPTSRPK